MEELQRLIRTSYGTADNRFAGHPLDAARAARSIIAANDAGVSFEDFVQMHRDYLNGKGLPPEQIEAQIARVRNIENYFN